MQMQTDKYSKQEIRFLLKEKYHFTELQIIDAINMGYKPNYEGPIAYLIGYSMFLGNKIDLRYKPLIPRPETEYWVDMIMEKEKAHLLRDGVKILDLFCGSGCIGISILKRFPKSLITFIDIDDLALKQTLLNIEINDIKSNPSVLKSDVFSNTEDKFDYIFANPPYVSEDDTVDSSLKYEPRRAIFASDMGTDIIRIFLNDLPKHLNKGGKAYMEFGSNQKDLIEKILKDKSLSYQFYKDQYNKDRFVELINS